EREFDPRRLHLRSSAATPRAKPARRNGRALHFNTGLCAHEGFSAAGAIAVSMERHIGRDTPDRSQGSQSFHWDRGYCDKMGEPKPLKALPRASTSFSCASKRSGRRFEDIQSIPRSKSPRVRQIAVQPFQAGLLHPSLLKLVLRLKLRHNVKETNVNTLLVSLMFGFFSASSHAQQLSHAACTPAIGLDRHSRQRRLDVMRLHEDRLKPRFGEARIEPL